MSGEKKGYNFVLFSAKKICVNQKNSFSEVTGELMVSLIAATHRLLSGWRLRIKDGRALSDLF